MRILAMSIVQLKFRVITMKTLIDTGQISKVIKAALVRQVSMGYGGDEYTYKEILIKVLFSKRGAVIANKVRVLFEFEERRFSQFYVVERIAYKIILGIDFLTKPRMIVRCGRQLRYDFEEDMDETGIIVVLLDQKVPGIHSENSKYKFYSSKVILSPSKYSPSTATHLCQRLIQLSKHFWNSTVDIAIRVIFDFFITSFRLLKRVLRNDFLT